MNDLTKLTINELLNDFENSIEDIAVCRWAQNQGIKAYAGGSIAERLTTNTLISVSIRIEIKNRITRGDTYRRRALALVRRLAGERNVLRQNKQAVELLQEFEADRVRMNTVVAAFERERDELQAEVERLRAALEEVETTYDVLGVLGCPWCGAVALGTNEGIKVEHATNCQRQVALKGGD